MSTSTPLKTSAMCEAIKCAYRAKRAFYLHGQPGSAKSDIVRQAAKELGVELRDVRASQLESVDLRGLPYIQDGRTFWSAPSFLPTDMSSCGILFLDELNQASQSTQAAAYQLILDRRLGDYKLPDGWVVIAAGNRAIDRAIANKMGSALKNRFVHSEMAVDNDEWLKWGAKNGIHPSILGYIRYRPQGLNDLAGNGSEGKKRMEAALEGNAFATPRSWAFASDIINAQPHPDVEYAMLAGTIGEANVADYVAFLRVYRDLPDLDDVIKNPTKHEVPTDPKIRYAISSGLSHKATAENFENVMKFMCKMPKEFQVLVVKDVQNRDWNITGTKAYCQWVDTNSSYLG